MHLTQLLLTLTAVDAAAMTLRDGRDQVGPAHRRVGVGERQFVARHGAGQAGLRNEESGQVKPERNAAW